MKRTTLPAFADRSTLAPARELGFIRLGEKRSRPVRRAPIKKAPHWCRRLRYRFYPTANEQRDRNERSRVGRAGLGGLVSVAVVDASGRVPGRGSRGRA